MSKRHHRGIAAAAVVVALAGLGQPALADPGDIEAVRAISSLVPADSLVAYMARPYGESEAHGEATTQPGIDGKAPPSLSIGSILAILSAGGLIPEEGQVFADIGAALPLLGQFEHALVLLDVSSRVVHPPGESEADSSGRVSLRLKHLQAAVILRTQGEHRAVLRQLNRIVGRYTHSEVAVLSRENAAGFHFQRLTDDRLPGWAVWEWGRLDDFFVVTFGSGAFPKIAETYAGTAPSLRDEPWFVKASQQTQGDRAVAQWFIAMARLEQRLGQVARGRHLRVVKALGADGMTQDLWTIGLEGRALAWFRCYRRNDQDVVVPYSDPKGFPAQHLRIIPDAARHFGIIHIPTSWLIEKLPAAWLAAQSESHVRKWTTVWRRLEQETGIDINGSLIEHLGDDVAIFDYPPHPLKIPFAWTIAIEIDDRQAVQLATDTLLATWSRYLDERAERKGTTLVRVKVKQAEDGVWYLQAGILGPAMKVTDRYLVLSWSPQALRDVLKFIDQQPRPSS
ncbi:MAG: hypothetical protein ABII12_01595 [Planctomycetota bacterium]